jgi:predicted transcriptional regulator
MSVQGLPIEGLNTVGQIVATNALTFHAGENGLKIAVALLSTHTAGAPVVDETGSYIGFINEFDVMKTLDAGNNLVKLTAADIMRNYRLVIDASMKIVDSAKMMEEHHVISLPVEKNGLVAYSVSRHDLLRARIGLGLGMGLEP